MLVVLEISCTLLKKKFYYRIARCFNFNYLSLELGYHFENMQIMTDRQTDRTVYLTQMYTMILLKMIK